MICTNCPRHCGIDRTYEFGFCGMKENPVVAKACLHSWEEPVISGSRGSGTVFFSGCSLRCIFCQNEAISHVAYVSEITTKQLANIFLRLQASGAHNINLVNPTHFAQAIIESLDLVRSRLSIPVIWNSSGYECVETVKKLEGYVDVYLPDIKYWSPTLSKLFSGVSDYFELAQTAIFEMFRQVGDMQLNDEGMIEKGLIIRHLVLPNCTHDSIKILKWISQNFPKGIMVSLMSQFTPNHKTMDKKYLNRRITKEEYRRVNEQLMRLGLDDGFTQDLESAHKQYIPVFDLEGVTED